MYINLTTILFSNFFFFLALVFAVPVKAVCPLCTVAVAGGLGISRWLGIDDSIMGVWIGGLILSSGFWLADWVSKKSWQIPYPKFLANGLMFLLVVPPLYWSKIMGLAGNTLWGIDKILLGTVIGAVLFYVSMKLDLYLRSINEGKVYIYYQKVILPILLLTLGSFVLFLITI
jgi:hypothetical protein